MDYVLDHIQKATKEIEKSRCSDAEKGIGHALIAIALALSSINEAIRKKKPE